MILRRYHKIKALNEPTSEVNKGSNVIVYDDVTKSDIVKQLGLKGISYNKRDSKRDLYDLLLGSE